MVDIIKTYTWISYTQLPGQQESQDNLDAFYFMHIKY